MGRGTWFENLANPCCVAIAYGDILGLGPCTYEYTYFLLYFAHACSVVGLWLEHTMKKNTNVPRCRGVFVFRREMYVALSCEVTKTKPPVVIIGRVRGTLCA